MTSPTKSRRKIDAPAPNLSHRRAGDPLPVAPPRILPGRRARVMIRYPGFEIFDLHENALMRSCVDPREAYIPCFPSYKRKKTLAGYVEICSVLKLVRYEPTDDGDVVYYYEMTDRHVAIKVCQVEKMNSLQRTNKEDPMKEMSIMQILGTAVFADN